MVSEVAWGDGTGDKIYLTYSASEGNQTVAVSSDANTGAARSKTVTFSASGVTPVTLTVNQEAGGSPLPSGAIPCELIFGDGYSAFINTSLIPSTSMSFEIDVCWVKVSSGLECLFGYMISGVRYAPIVRETYLEVQYNNWYNTSWKIPPGIVRYHHKIVATNTGTTIRTYTPDGQTLLDTQTVSYSQSVTFSQTIGIFGRKSSASAITSGTGRSGIGRFKCYGDDHFGTLVADFMPCYYNGNYGFWENVGGNMLIGNTPAKIGGFGQYWDTQGFFPNTRNTDDATRADYLIDYRDCHTTRKFAVPPGCTQIRFNAGTVQSTANYALMLFDDNDVPKTYWNYNSADRVISVGTGQTQVRMSMASSLLESCYIYDVTHSQYIWKGANVV